MKSTARALMAAAAAVLLLAACNRAVDKVPPEVSITTPASGASATVGVGVEIAGTSSDDRLVRTVTVQAGDRQLADLVPQDDGSWTLSWLPQEPGSISLTAVATDLGGNRTTSAEVLVEVQADGSVPGTLSGTLSRAGALPEPAVATAAAQPAAISPGGLFINFGRQANALELGSRPGFVASASAAGFDFSAAGDFEFAGHTFELVRAFPGDSGLAFYRVAGLGTEATLELRAELQRSALVSSVYPNWIMEAQAEPADPYYVLQAWHYGQINLEAAWDLEDGSTNPVQVAVLDTGSYAHPDLEWGVGVNLVGFYGQMPLDGLPFNDPSSTGSDHGTHVAGTIGALSNNTVGVAGVNWGLPPIIPVKVLGGGGSGDLLDVFEGIFWAVGDDIPAYNGHVNLNPARVINLSLGGAIAEPCPPDFDAVFQYAHEVAGTIAVVSAGNSGSPTDAYFPANCPSVITVGATGPTGARAGYSNFGAHLDLMAPGGDSSYAHPAAPEDPSLFAGVLSTVEGGYGLNQGTSMAAPHVAGAVSLLLSQEPDLTLDEVRERLHMASRPMPLAACDQATAGLEGLNMCGAGLLDAAALLEGADLASPAAVIYAVPAGTEDQAEVTMSELGGLASLAAHRTDGVLVADGSFTFEFTALPPGEYRIIGVELRQSGEGVGMTDHYAVANVVIEPGGSAELQLETEPVWLLAHQ